MSVVCPLMAIHAIAVLWRQKSELRVVVAPAQPPGDDGLNLLAGIAGGRLVTRNAVQGGVPGHHRTWIKQARMERREIDPSCDRDRSGHGREHNRNPSRSNGARIIKSPTKRRAPVTMRRTQFRTIKTDLGVFALD